MSIQEELATELRDAMKSQDKARRDVIRQVQTEVATAKSDPDFAGEVDDAFYVKVITSYVKKMDKARQEYLEMGERGEALAAGLGYEVRYLSRWLPIKLDEEATRALVRETIAELGAAGDQRAAGRVTGTLMKTRGSDLDGGLVSRIVSEELAVLTLPQYQPMLATLWPEPFDDDGWWFEIKWDGYRAIVGSENGRLAARSRRGLNLLDRFPELKDLDVPDGVVLDGEAVAFDDEGRPSFALLQEGHPVNLVVFDLLFHGRDLTGLPYEDRRARLERLALGPPIVVPEPTPGLGTALYEAVTESGIEGIVGKRLGSVYRPGRRSADWRKISSTNRVRAVVGGYLEGEGSRASTFGSLLVGLNSDQGLRWIGAVGSGFDDRTLTALHQALKELERPTSPFSNPVTLPGKRTWVEPGIVVAIEFKNWTGDDRLRAPVFKGVETADPQSVTWNEERP